MSESPAPTVHRGPLREIFLVFLKLGLTAFGGPIAHLAFFRTEFVQRRRWLDENSFADLLALAQFLPGPTSTKVGFAIGMLRGGLPGALVAYIAFALPSMLIMFAAAYGVEFATGGVGSGIVHGLKLVAVAVVAQAVWNMAGNLCPDRTRATIAVCAALALLLVPHVLIQVLVIVGGAIAGVALLRGTAAAGTVHLPIRVHRRAAAPVLVVFAVLLFALPPLAAATNLHAIDLLDATYRAGSLVFGGGHVILPLLERAFVPPGWISSSDFLAGYGIAQALPGPLFSFGAFLGAAETPEPNGIAGGLIALAGMSLPGLMLMYGALPFWSAIRHRPTAQAALRGINAAVVGVLVAALYDPIWTSTIHKPADFAAALAAFGALMLWNAPPWLVVLAAAALGAVIH